MAASHFSLPSGTRVSVHQEPLQVKLNTAGRVDLGHTSRHQDIIKPGWQHYHAKAGRRGATPRARSHYSRIYHGRGRGGTDSKGSQPTTSPESRDVRRRLAPFRAENTTLEVIKNLASARREYRALQALA